jgi:cytosylglucuronate decarboxylase
MGPTNERARYLYIRIQEACNAGCFMCGFANSRDGYRYPPSELESLLGGAYKEGVRFLKFTGGEPLMHERIEDLVALGHRGGMKTGLITNGKLLPRMIDGLAAAGLHHVTVSIDSPDSQSHDLLRDTKGSFKNAVAGIRKAKELGLNVRVNTVVGPHNYKQMPDMQRLLTDLAVDSWELSAIKLSPMPKYDDVESVREIGRAIRASAGLQPRGPLWFGDSADEQARYFDAGTPPRAMGPRCYAAEDVVYLDAKNKQLFPCSCIAHVPRALSVRTGTRVDLGSPELARVRTHFSVNGPNQCQNCSSSAAGYTRTVESTDSLEDWAY